MMKFGSIKSDSDLSDFGGTSIVWENSAFHCPSSYPVGGFIVNTGKNISVSTMLISVENQGANFDLLMPVITYNSPSIGKCKVKLYGMQGNRPVEVKNGTNLSDTIFHIIVFGS